MGVRVVGSLKEELKWLLALVDILEPLSDEELGVLAARCAVVRLDDNELLVGPEEYADHVLLLLRGRVLTYEAGPQARKPVVTVTEAEPSWELGGSPDALRVSTCSRWSPRSCVT